MPLPRPDTGEHQEEWIRRCMSNETVMEDFPDNEQRYAVCIGIWEEAHKDMNSELLTAIRNRQQKQTEFGYGIMTADRWVRNMQELAGLDLCYRYASVGKTSFNDVVEKAARTLTYSNSDMIVEEKGTSTLTRVPDEIALPKNTLMVFRHVLTTPKIDRDGDILRTQGAAVDPKMLLLWQHVHTLPIGKMLAVVEHSEKQLVLISCIVDMNELSHDAAVMVDNDMARFSHGFRALEWEQRKADEGDTTGGEGFEITKFEIMEESIVSVPSNTDAAQEEVLLSLVEGGKLTSGLMKEVGRTIRDHRSVQVSVAADISELPEVENEDKSDIGSGETGTRGAEIAGADGPSEEAPAIPAEAATEEPAEIEEVNGEKAGRTLSARTLTVLKECLEDLDELIEKGFEMTRGGTAICERVQRKLATIIESAGGNEEEEEEKQLTMQEAMAFVAAKADRKQRDKMVYILQALSHMEDREEKNRNFRSIVRRGR